MERHGDVGRIPGTEVVFLASRDAASKPILIPQPSTTALDDPLNWSATWKTIVIVNQFVFVFVSIMTPLAIAPLTQLFMAEFHKTIPQVNLLFGVAAITLGYANFLIVPAANVFGRRPIIALCGLVCVLANVWQALVTSYPSFIGSRVVSGFGAAANESIMPMVVADVLFLHQRGRSMALYFWAYFIGLFFGPIISGAIASHMNWRWFFWVCTILQAVSLVLIVIALPETRYTRHRQRGKTAVSSRSKSDTSEKSPVVVQDMEQASADAAATTPAVPSVAYGRTRSAVPNGTARAAGATNVADAADAADAADTYPLLGKGRPSLAQFSLIPRLRFNHSWAMVVRDVVSPMQILFCYPIVLWASLTMGFAANSLLALNLTQAQVFGPPPYLFTPDQIGYVNFAFAVGAVVALLTAGPLSDWTALRAARRNGGVIEAEMRLPALVPFVVASLVGMTVAAVGYQRSWDWPVIVVVGYGLVGVQVVGIPAVVIAYAVDSYRHLPGEIMIAATIVKNSFGFAMIFFFNDWAARHGYLAPVLMLMAVTVGLSVLGLAIFLPFGKTCRRWTMNSSLHSL